MKRAQAHKVCTALFQLHITPHDVDHIGPGQKLLNKSLRNRHGAILTCCVSDLAGVKKPAQCRLLKISAAIHFAGVFSTGCSDCVWIVLAQSALNRVGAISWVFAERAGFADHGRYMLRFARDNRSLPALRGDKTQRDVACDNITTGSRYNYRLWPARNRQPHPCGGVSARRVTYKSGRQKPRQRRGSFYCTGSTCSRR